MIMMLADTDKDSLRCRSSDLLLLFQQCHTIAYQDEFDGGNLRYSSMRIFFMPLNNPEVFLLIDQLVFSYL